MIMKCRYMLTENYRWCKLKDTLCDYDEEYLFECEYFKSKYQSSCR